MNINSNGQKTPGLFKPGMNGHHWIEQRKYQFAK